MVFENILTDMKTSHWSAQLQMPKEVGYIKFVLVKQLENVSRWHSLSPDRCQHRYKQFIEIAASLGYFGAVTSP